VLPLYISFCHILLFGIDNVIICAANVSLVINSTLKFFIYVLLSPGHNFINGLKSGLVVSKLDSRLEGCGFESYPILDGNCVNAMPGLIPAPNFGSFNN
jgi:hypothetical protein